MIPLAHSDKHQVIQIDVYSLVNIGPKNADTGDCWVVVKKKVSTLINYIL